MLEVNTVLTARTDASNYRVFIVHNPSSGASIIINFRMMVALSQTRARKLYSVQLFTWCRIILFFRGYAILS